MSYPNGTTVDYTYNGATGWLSQVAHQKEGAANPFLSLTYARNGIGLIKGVSESANGAATGSWTYDYDGLKRLTAATWTPTTGSSTAYGYTYDRNGSRRSYDVTGSARRHYVYNELDQLREERLGASFGASTLDKSYTWDKYGRMGSETASGGSPTVARLYKWTVDDRLVSVVLGDNPSNDAVIKYAYNHLGTRVSRSALGETAKHLTDYENPSGYSQTLAEVEGDGLNVLKNYFYGSEYGPLAQRGTGANSLAFLHGDHLQTTRQLTDSDGDVLLASSQKYEPFGTPTPDALSSLTSYAFTGQSRDLDTGLQYHRARWLNTSQGRWLSTDPVFDFPGNFGSMFGYSGMSPLAFLDIAGRNLSLGVAVVIVIFSAVYLFSLATGAILNTATPLVSGQTLAGGVAGNTELAFQVSQATNYFNAAYEANPLGPGLTDDAVRAGASSSVRRAASRDALQASKTRGTVVRFADFLLSWGKRRVVPGDGAPAIRLMRESGEDIYVTTFSHWGRAEGLAGSGFQRGHLNQTASMRISRLGKEVQLIAQDDGYCVLLKGDAMYAPGTEHYKFHAALDDWLGSTWSRNSFGPSSTEYNEGVRAGLRAVGRYTDDEVEALVQIAWSERRSHGILDSDLLWVAARPTAIK